VEPTGEEGGDLNEGLILAGGGGGGGGLVGVETGEERKV